MCRPVWNDLRASNGPTDRRRNRLPRRAECDDWKRRLVSDRSRVSGHGSPWIQHDVYRRRASGLHKRVGRCRPRHCRRDENRSRNGSKVTFLHGESWLLPKSTKSIYGCFRRWTRGGQALDGGAPGRSDGATARSSLNVRLQTCANVGAPGGLTRLVASRGSRAVRRKLRPGQTGPHCLSNTAMSRTTCPLASTVKGSTRFNDIISTFGSPATGRSLPS